MDGALLLRALIFFSLFYGRLVELARSPWEEESGTEAGRVGSYGGTDMHMSE